MQSRLNTALIALVPLLIAPGLLFHYDITPKIILAALAAALMLFRSHGIAQNRYGRWLTALAAAQIVWMGIVTSLSTRPWFSLLGNNWRRMGLLTMLALAVITVCWTRDFSRVSVIACLRAFTIAALLASVYGIAQYFDIDPFQTPAAYHAHAGDSVIVRPPGTLGHADYFAWWLSIAFFASAALAGVSEGAWRRVAQAACAASAAAILLSGTRSGIVAVVAGCIVWTVAVRVRIGGKHLVGAAIAVALFAAFYISPAGLRLRARSEWSLTEPTGGARPLLWKDSLRMAAARPLTGFGPETFAAEFPKYQSVDLARLLPDFYYESPHNSALDVLTEQGIPGLLLAASWLGLGFLAAREAMRRNDLLAAPLMAALAASAVASMFSAMTFGPIFGTAAIVAMLVSLPPREQQIAPKGIWKAATLPIAVCLMLYAGSMTIAEYRLARFQNAQGPEALALWPAAARAELPGAGEDIFASRKLDALCQTVGDPVRQIECRGLAAGAARRSLESADNPPNAWYNFAVFSAAQNDPNGVERALRTAQSLAPNWFKPHWSLANLLALKGRNGEARAEAARAAMLDAGKDSEVLETMRRLTN